VSGWTRASNLDRTLQCLGHLTLPWDDTKSDRAIEAAAYGTLVHTWKETGKVDVNSSYPGHAKTFEKKLTVLEAAGLSRQDIWPTGFHEVSFAFNCKDGRLGTCWVKGEAAHQWKKSHGKQWITGSADLIDVDQLWVDDLKTGMVKAEPDELGQLFFYAMCLSKYVARQEPVKVSITHWPKYPIDALPNRLEAEISYKKLVKCEQYLMSLYGDFKAGKTPFALGPECDFCPAFAACPLQRNI
jgi:hypothetical protein